jgi:hypothetical protein
MKSKNAAATAAGSAGSCVTSSLARMRGFIPHENYMSIFNWFSHPTQANPANPEEPTRPPASRKKESVPPPKDSEIDQRSDRTKMRHLRREQSFVAIREAMTRTGILSSNYKFKVFSEDLSGSEFVVMINLVTVAGDPLPLVNDMEAVIIENAKARFGIVITAVYWRITEIAAVAKPAAPPVAERAPAVQPPKSKSSHDTIDADEVLAFQQALVAASAQGQTLPPEKASKDRSIKPRPQSGDFEDTQLVESKAPHPASKTQ